MAPTTPVTLAGVVSVLPRKPLTIQSSTDHSVAPPFGYLSKPQIAIQGLLISKTRGKHTHERRLEEVPARKHLVRGRELPELPRAAPDLGNAVPGGGEDEEHGGRDGPGHDGPAAALGAVEGEQRQAARGRAEQQRQRQRRGSWQR